MPPPGPNGPGSEAGLSLLGFRREVGKSRGPTRTTTPTRHGGEWRRPNSREGTARTRVVGLPRQGCSWKESAPQSGQVKPGERMIASFLFLPRNTPVDL